MDTTVQVGGIAQHGLLLHKLGLAQMIDSYANMLLDIKNRTAPCADNEPRSSSSSGMASKQLGSLHAHLAFLWTASKQDATCTWAAAHVVATACEVDITKVDWLLLADSHCVLLQLTLALRAVHTAGLACSAGCLHQSKVLLTSPGRIRIGELRVPHTYQSLPVLTTDAPLLHFSGRDTAVMLTCALHEVPVKAQ